MKYMKAIKISRYGGPEVLEFEEVPTPRPGDGEVTIDVTHAAVGLIDVLIRRGAFADYDLPMQPPFIPGIEAAGIVREIGRGVTTLAVGDLVSTLSISTGGGYAEVMVAPAAVTVRLPDGIDPAQAVAALPNATTAQLVLTRAVTVPAGAKVLVHGATGALASVFPAIARRLGASEVVGTVRSENRVARAIRLGFDRVVIAGEIGRALEGEAFDIIVDPVGGRLRSDSMSLLAPMGRLVAVGSADNRPSRPIDANELWFSNTGVVGFAVGQFLAEFPKAAGAASAEALILLADGTIRLDVATLPLASAAEAHAQMDAGGVTGRLVLTV